MKVIIVEDNAFKCRRVTSSLVECGINISDIEHVTTAFAARRSLLKQNYDLMMLDIVIPARLDEELSITGGVDLLHQITDHRNYCAPSFVVGLTQLSDNFSSIQNLFSDRNFTVIKYDETSDEWSEILMAKIKQMITAKHLTRKKAEYNAFGAFICALNTELEGILNNGWQWEEEKISNDHTIYYKATVRVDDETRTFYAAACSRMGMPAAAILSTKLISLFQPRYLIMTGIMAGVKERVELGDIIVADPVWDYGSGKFQVENGEPVFSPDPYQLPLDSELKSIIDRIKRDPDILFKLKGKIAYNKPKTEASLHIGPIGSGAAVLADGRMIKELESKQQRKLLGIEMEAYSVFLAAQESLLPKPKAFCIKAVVDFADGSKNDNFHEFSLRYSANLATLIFEKYIKQSIDRV